MVFFAFVALALVAWPAGADAQMVTGPAMTDFAKTFGLGGKTDATLRLADSSIPAAILFATEQPTFVVRVTNPTDKPLKVRGRVEVIQYGTRGRPGDRWTPTVFKIADVAAAPLVADVPAGESMDVRIAPKIPLTLGAYALVSDVGGARTFLYTFVRTFEPLPQRTAQPKIGLDNIGPEALRRLGVHAVRYGLGYKPTTDPDYEAWYQNEVRQLREFQQADIAVLLLAGGGQFDHPCQPLGMPRPWLDGAGRMLDTRFDLAWLPAWDADFKKWVKRFCREQGWPRGPVSAVCLWNEPWEGSSVSGWGADIPRFREMYTAMAYAVREAIAEARVDVLVGGGDSTSNAIDKLFSDGSDAYLKYFDFCSIHDQGLDSRSTIKAWVDRPGPRGRVKIWDTESWIANTDDRVAAMIAAERAAGYDRVAGVYGGNLCGREGAWPVAAAVGAATHFIGERDFREILFPGGLPWVFVFDGLPGAGGKPSPDDGTLVVVGNLGDVFGADNVLFRTAPLAPGATMTLDSPSGNFNLYDLYGNSVPARGNRLTVPLDGRAFFLRAAGRPGSFAELVQAARAATLAGVGPVAPVCHDMTAPIDGGAALRLSLTNVTNRPVTGRLTVRLGGVTVDPATQTFTIGGHETAEVTLKVSGKPDASNTYPLEMVFDAGPAGRVVHREEMHVNLIVRRTITVDGNLDDWKDVPPQPLFAAPAGGGQENPVIPSEQSGSRNLAVAVAVPSVARRDSSTSLGVTAKSDLSGSSEASGPAPMAVARLATEPVDAAPVALGYLACDDRFFYFAARIADVPPDPGMPRFESQSDDAYFYPAKCMDGKGNEHAWPEGVRRFSYRREPELPSGNSPAHANVQIAFNVLPAEEKPWRPAPPGTFAGFIVAKCTDYEYALNPVDPAVGGGTELWRLEVPGMPRKNFYPREPRSTGDGPVRDGRLAIRRQGRTMIVECAIPWSELPDVKKRFDAGGTVKFSFRVNMPQAAECLELSRGRSVAKRGLAFHGDSALHWSNEVEFGFEK